MISLRSINASFITSISLYKYAALEIRFHRIERPTAIWHYCGSLCRQTATCGVQAPRHAGLALHCTHKCTADITSYDNVPKERAVLASCQDASSATGICVKTVMQCVYHLTHIWGFILNTPNHQQCCRHAMPLRTLPYSISITSGHKTVWSVQDSSHQLTRAC